jgi:hypothetical protein
MIAEYQRILSPFIWAMHTSCEFADKLIHNACILAVAARNIARSCGNTADEHHLLEKGIAELKQFCFVQPSDKAKNQPIFMCAVYASSLVRNDQLHNSDCYTQVSEPDHALLTDQFPAIVPSLQFPT